jgi:pyruvate/2-oxoglutarate dehydrogenase complex dihydrolipoamide acyltransferase (E2) component
MRPKDTDRFTDEQAAIEVRSAWLGTVSVGSRPQPTVLAGRAIVAHHKKLLVVDAKIDLIAARKTGPSGRIGKQLTQALQARQPFPIVATCGGIVEIWIITQLIYRVGRNVVDIS